MVAKNESLDKLGSVFFPPDAKQETKCSIMRKLTMAKRNIPKLRANALFNLQQVQSKWKTRVEPVRAVVLYRLSERLLKCSLWMTTLTM